MALYRNLEVVASDTENPGLLTIGALVNGSFVAIGGTKVGLLESLAKNPTALEVASESEASSDTPSQ